MRSFAMMFGVALSIGGPSIAGATTYTVLPDGSGDFPTIQAAVNGAATGDVIVLGTGTFTGPGNRDVSIVGKSLTIRSQSGYPGSCAIECEGAGRGFYLDPSVNGTVFEGFTVAGGTADQGGAILDESGSSFQITDCIFRDNSAGRGGAVGALGGGPSFLRCDFTGNSAVEVGGGFGGGWEGSPNVTFDECRFVGNGAGTTGGGVFIEAVAPARDAALRNCVFADNASDIGAAVSFIGAGGGIEHCTFARNDAATNGTIAVSFGDVTIDNCVIALAPAGSAVRCEGTASATLTCCDVFGNAGGDWIGCLAGQEGLNGNLALDPLFCDVTGGDFRLQADSPCGPDYNPDCGLIGGLPTGCQPVAVGTTTWGALKAKFRD